MSLCFPTAWVLGHCLWALILPSQLINRLTCRIVLEDLDYTGPFAPVCTPFRTFSHLFAPFVSVEHMELAQVAETLREIYEPRYAFPEWSIRELGNGNLATHAKLAPWQKRGVCLL